MATYTSKLNLKKPATTDNININDINSNMDIIDAFCKDLQQDYIWTGNTLTLSQFIEDCENRIGTTRGMKYLGYLNSSVATQWGLDFNGPVFGSYHTEGTKSIYIVSAWWENFTIGKISKSGGVWYEKICIIRDMFYTHDSDLILSSQIYEAYGRITSGGQKIAMIFPIGKYIQSGTTIQLQPGSHFEVRGINGYVGNFTAGNSEEVVNNPDYNVTCTATNGRTALKIEITKTSGTFGVLNNTPIQAYTATLNVKFI